MGQPMDKRTMTVALAAIAMIGAVIFFISRASVERTKLKTEASVSRTQERTQRAHERHNLIEGVIRGWKKPRESEN